MSNQEGQNQQPQMSQNQRNAQNNANTIKNAADVAIASKNPYAMAAGGAVKLADKVSGGRASQDLGKKMNTLNKIAPGGRKIQKASNMLAETGAGDAIGKAASMKSGGGGAAGGQSSSFANGMVGAAGTANTKGKSALDKTAADEEKEEEAKERQTGQFVARMPLKVKLALICGVAPALCFFFVVIVVVVCYVADEGLFGSFAGPASTTSDYKEFKQDLIENRDEFGMGGVSDVELGMGSPYSSFCHTSSCDEFGSRYELFENVYSYFECESQEECLEQPEIQFILKVNAIHTRYKYKYHVYLTEDDWSLIMATILSNGMDITETYESHLSPYDENKVEKYNVLLDLDWDYDYKKNLGDSYLSGSYYAYDLQILVKNMVQKTTTQTCAKKIIDSEGNSTFEITKSQTDYDIEDEYFKKGQEYYLECALGETYDITHTYARNRDKYNEFLLEYIEYKYYVNSGGTGVNLMPFRCVAEDFPTYDLSEEQLKAIASQAYHEQGTPKGAAAEASLMANRFELYGSSYGTGADGLYNYVRTSKWFANAPSNMDSYDAPDAVVEAVRDVLVNGKRTLPAYIDEHDWINDLTSVTTDGKAIDRNNRDAYEANKTIIKNRYGATYTFYSFPDTDSDPFGYTSEDKRSELGDFHYDFDTGEAVSCSSNGEYLFPLPEGSTSCRSSAYGPRIHPITGEYQNHSGDDYPAAGGTPVYAAADGVVISAGTGCSIGDYSCYGGMGNHVIIDHGNGIQSVYMHATKVNVRTNQKVNKGDVIMTVGTTGSSTGNHLHITFKKNGVKDDPANYIGALPMC